MRRKLLQADCGGQELSGRFAGRLSRPDAAPFCPRERVFLAQEVEHRAPDTVFGVGSEFEVTGRLETVHRLNQANGACADQVVKGDAGWHPELEPPRKDVYVVDVLKDSRFPGCTGLGTTAGEIRQGHFVEVHFRFLLLPRSRPGHFGASGATPKSEAVSWSALLGGR